MGRHARCACVCACAKKHMTPSYQDLQTTTAHALSTSRQRHLPTLVRQAPQARAQQARALRAARRGKGGRDAPCADGVGVNDLALVILQQVGQRSVQHAGRAFAQRGRVLVGHHALATSLQRRIHTHAIDQSCAHTQAHTIKGRSGALAGAGMQSARAGT